MSTEKEDLVRRFTEEAFRKKDPDILLSSTHPDIEVDWSSSIGPFQDVYHGHDQVTRFWEALWEAWDEFTPQIETIIECGEDRLLTEIAISARGKASGIEVNSRGATLWTFRDDKIVGARLFQSLDEALEVVRPKADARPDFS
jgi:ketosteroid isomerase-like protein